MSENIVSGRGKHILIVEDEQYLRELYQEVLQNEGYVVDTASDGEEGYQALLSNDYDLVLLDLMMPKLDGIAVLKKIQTEKRGKPLQNVVVLTNVPQHDAIDESISLGAKGYLMKSTMTPDDLVKEVKNYLFGQE